MPAGNKGGVGRKEMCVVEKVVKLCVCMCYMCFHLCVTGVIGNL